MKLGALKTAIRELKIAPKALIRFGCDKRTMTLDLQKTPLLAELDKVFTGGRSEETGMDITADGYLSHLDELTADSETITISLKDFRQMKAVVEAYNAQAETEDEGDLAEAADAVLAFVDPTLPGARDAIEALKALM